MGANYPFSTGDYLRWQQGVVRVLGVWHGVAYTR